MIEGLRDYNLRFGNYELRIFIMEFIANLELIHKKLLNNLIKEANELVSIFTAALKTSKMNRKSQISNRKSNNYG